MFTRYYIELPEPPAVVESALLGITADRLGSLARQADDKGHGLLVDVGVGQGPVRVDKEVTVKLGEPQRLPSRTIVPLRWEATGASVLFPRLEADLEVGGLGPNRTQLSISATYDPPLGQVGALLDRVLLHRLAEATVKDFLDRLGAALQQRMVVEQVRRDA